MTEWCPPLNRVESALNEDIVTANSHYTYAEKSQAVSTENTWHYCHEASPQHGMPSQTLAPFAFSHIVPPYTSVSMSPIK